MNDWSLPSNSKSMAGGSGVGAASKLLAGLPSRGFLSSTVSTNPVGMRVYICEHETNPPEHQVLKTDQMNILIRSLKLKKQKSEMKSAAEGSRKRVPERATDGRTSAKRPMTVASLPEGSNSQGLDNYHCLTVERLRAILKERGLSPKGKKDELVARLRASKQ